MTLVRFVPEADMQVLGPDSCSTLLSSIEIIREIEKGAGYDEARAPVDAKGTVASKKDRQSCRPFRLRAAADWV
jgi:hypothetical protein